MQYPLIGVSGSLSKDETQSFLLRCYMQRLTDAGAIPLLLSPDMTNEQIAHCAEQLDGLMLAGGNDADPALYHEEPHPALGEVSPLRDRLEVLLIPAFLRKEKPIFGICRGIQLLNAALGGSLYQDLPAQFPSGSDHPRINHSQPAPYSVPAHSVQIDRASMLYRIIQADELPVNSMHHQAVKATAPGLVPCAVSPDGVIEAVELPDKPFVLGVQWHPERLRDDASQKLFAAFADAARVKCC